MLMLIHFSTCKVLWQVMAAPRALSSVVYRAVQVSATVTSDDCSKFQHTETMTVLEPYVTVLVHLKFRLPRAAAHRWWRIVTVKMVCVDRCTGQADVDIYTLALAGEICRQCTGRPVNECNSVKIVLEIETRSNLCIMRTSWVEAFKTDCTLEVPDSNCAL